MTSWRQFVINWELQFQELGRIRDVSYNRNRDDQRWRTVINKPDLVVLIAKHGHYPSSTLFVFYKRDPE